MKKLLVLCFTIVVAVCLSAPLHAQDADKVTASKKEPGKEARWEGTVARSNPDKSMLTVRKQGSNVEKDIHYDSSTQWSSKEHRSKKINDITAADVKDGDRVIVLGMYDDKGDFHATMVSKRLTPH